MKFLALSCGALVSLSMLAGCSGDDGEIAVDAATTPLTAEGSDKLFTVRIVAAREGGYALDGLVVKAIVEGKDPVKLACSPADSNGNGKLEKDEKLECNEPADNQLDASLAGKEVDVEVYAQIDGEETKVGGATWTPPK